MAMAIAQEDVREFEFGDQEFRFLVDLVNARTGIVLAEHKKDMVYSRLVRRVRVLKLKSFAEYCELVQGDGGGEETGHLVNAITTNLTSFFRERHHFHHLYQAVLPSIMASPPSDRKLRIWSAACSSGMEPYSIAMTVKAAVPDLRSWDARILATDIDTNMLRLGAAGEYASEQYKNIPDVCREYVALSEAEDFMHMPQDLKDMVAFKELNLLGAWPMKGLFDAVFCRNVVIYFDKAAQIELFARIADVIKPGGWLYIGHSENLYKVCDRFELAGRTIYRKVR